MIIFTLSLISIAIIKLIWHFSTKYTLDGATLTNSHRQVYYNYTHTGWKPIEWGNRIGWVDDPKSILNYSVYSVKGDDDLRTIVLWHPLKEFSLYLRRSDIAVPEINIEDINRIELTNLFADHRICNNGTTDKSIINEVVNIKKESKVIKPIEIGTESYKELLLYSDKLPGSTYPMDVWLMDDQYWLEYDYLEIPTKIDETLLKKIPGCE